MDNTQRMSEERPGCNVVTLHNPEFIPNAPFRNNQSQDQQLPAGRVRLYSESQVCSHAGRKEDTFQEGIESASESGGDGTTFRGRSQSAPAALWAAKKYGRQLRRMSDEFDNWLDSGEPKRGIGPGGTRLKQSSRGWFSFLWSQKEEEGRE